MNGIEQLNQHRVEYNLLTVVQSDNSQYPEEVFRFLTGLGSPFIQFIPIVEPDALTTVSTRVLLEASNGGVSSIKSSISGALGISGASMSSISTCCLTHQVILHPFAFMRRHAVEALPLSITATYIVVIIW